MAHSRPNILMILTDQHGQQAVSAYGNDQLHTPNLDALAAAGVRFEPSYCTSPVCAPSRASLITGRMPHEVGVDVNGPPIRPGTPTVGELLRAAGYETAWAGKRGLPPPTPEARQGLWGFADLPLPHPPAGHLGTQVDELIAQAGADFIARPHDRPFFLCVSLVNPHDICYWIMEQHRDVLDRVAVPGRRLPPLPPNFAVDPDEPSFIQECRRRDHYGNEIQWTASWDERRWREYLGVYRGLAERVDGSVGRLLSALRATGLEGETLVLFTTDHGEGQAAHHWVVKLMLYEEVARVPLIICWPGHTPAGVCDRTHLVSGLDVAPTLCDYAGAALPPGGLGHSLRAEIESPDRTPGHAFVVSELQPDPQRPAMRGRMLRTATCKYIAFSEGTRRELLFNLREDPGEMHDLARDPGAQDTLSRHRRLLHDWVRQTDDAFEVPG